MASVTPACSLTGAPLSRDSYDHDAVRPSVSPDRLFSPAVDFSRRLSPQASDWRTLAAPDGTHHGRNGADPTRPGPVRRRVLVLLLLIGRPRGSSDGGIERGKARGTVQISPIQRHIVRMNRHLPTDTAGYL